MTTRSSLRRNIVRPGSDKTLSALKNRALRILATTPALPIPPLLDCDLNGLLSCPYIVMGMVSGNAFRCSFEEDLALDDLEYCNTARYGYGSFWGSLFFQKSQIGQAYGAWYA